MLKLIKKINKNTNSSPAHCDQHEPNNGPLSNRRLDTDDDLTTVNCRPRIDHSKARRVEADRGQMDRRRRDDQRPVLLSLKLIVWLDYSMSIPI